MPPCDLRQRRGTDKFQEKTVPKTLLAVDDSATMRKVLEITFVGEDFNVLTASDRGALLAKLGENPIAVVIDTTLDGDDGYAICKEVRQRLPRAAVVLLASRYTPYDAARGRDAGADDYIDKPFDTQQLIDKVKKAIGVREATAPAAAEPPPRAEAPYRAPAPPIAPAPVAARPAYAPGPAPQRSGTLMFSADGPAAPPAPGAAPAPPPYKPAAPPMAAKPAPAPAPPAPAPAPAPPPAAAPAPAAHAVAAQANGQLAPKLAQLGLTQAQIDGVLALSREVIEQVVWEVVPQLAETLIKEEIARLTKE
jgi:CheY-like chemotaxis protein